jgi:DNA-binding beta-propeller fold protein YncE
MARTLARHSLVLALAFSSTLAALAHTSNAAPPAPPSAPLASVADLPLPGRATRFDYQWVDVKSRRLYLAHLGDGSLVVFDLDAQRVVREIPGLPSVHGVVAAPERHLVFATATADKTLAIIDDRTFQVLNRVPAGEYPNGLAYDPKSDRVFVSNNTGLGIAVVDVKAARALPGIDIGGPAGNTQYDAGTGHVFSAVHGRSFLVDVDPATATVAGRIALDGIASCHGLLVAAGLRLAFAACRGSGPTLVVVDLDTRRSIKSLPLPPDVDVLAFDASLRRLYAAAETGMGVVFSVGADRSVTELGRGMIGPNAHSVAVDPTTHRTYFPLEELDGRPVLRVMEPRPTR